MRKYSPRQTANRYLKMEIRGNLKDKKHLAFVIHKIIDNLFVIGQVSQFWQKLGKPHIENLIQHLKKSDINIKILELTTHSESEESFLSSPSNLSFIVGFLLVSFLIVTSCALSFARRRFRSVPSSASRVFCR
jgi:hypothetical protein